jgi:DNA-binding transcriptional regulator YiaG
MVATPRVFPIYITAEVLERQEQCTVCGKDLEQDTVARQVSATIVHHPECTKVVAVKLYNSSQLKTTELAIVFGVGLRTIQRWIGVNGHGNG